MFFYRFHIQPKILKSSLVLNIVWASQLNFLSRTADVISSPTGFKKDMLDAHRSFWNLYLIKNVESIVVFFIKKSKKKILQRKSKSHSEWETQLKINFQREKYYYLINSWTDKGFKSTVVKRKHLELLEITFRIPLRWVGRKVLTSKIL